MFKSQHANNIMWMHSFKSWWFIILYCVLLGNIIWFPCHILFWLGGRKFIKYVYHMFHWVLQTSHFFSMVWDFRRGCGSYQTNQSPLIILYQQLAVLKSCWETSIKWINQMELYFIWRILALISTKLGAIRVSSPWLYWVI